MVRIASFVVILVVLICGCGTIFHSGPAAINFGSKPEGASVIVNGQEMGPTPVTLQLHPNKTYTITYRKEGYQDATVTLNSHVGAGYVVLDVVVGFLGVVVDAATGDWKSFDEGQYYVELKAK